VPGQEQYPRRNKGRWKGSESVLGRSRSLREGLRKKLGQYMIDPLLPAVGSRLIRMVVLDQILQGEARDGI